MKFLEKQVKRHTVYDGSFIQVYEDDIVLPNNKPAKRVVVDHIGAAAILPITKNQEVVLVRQYRYAIQSDSLEIPAGKKDVRNEDGRVCAERELEEETGYQAQRIEKFTEVYTAIGFSNELIELFVGYDCIKLKDPKPSDEDEFVERVIIPIEDALNLVKTGVIKDAKTVIALSYLKALTQG